MKTNEPPARPVKTAETSFAVLEQLKRAETASLGVSELARRLDMAKSTVHRHVATLDSLGFVERVGDEYRIGLRMLDYGLYARNEHPLYAISRPKVDELADETDEKVWCMTVQDGRSVHLYGAGGKHSVQTSAREGKWGYLHRHAAGKAILAFLPESRAEAIVRSHGLPARTPNTIVDESELFEQLDRIRERGYAFNREESVAGLHAVGAPVTDESGVAIGALSISGPANRLKGRRFDTELPDLLLGSVNEIEINLSFA